MCKFDGTYAVPHHTRQPINCIFEDAPTAKRIEFSGGYLPSSSSAVLSPNEWFKYQCGEDHTLSGVPGSSDLFAMRCLDGDHTMTHCKPVQCGVPPVIAHATTLGGCFVTITYGKQVEYQCEAGYHVESERKSGLKSEGCHAKERAEPVQPLQAPEEPVSAVSSCGVLLKRHFFGLQGTQWMQNSAKGASCTSARGESSPRTHHREQSLGSMR